MEPTEADRRIRQAIDARHLLELRRSEEAQRLIDRLLEERLKA